VPNSLLEIGGCARDTYWDGHACLGVTHSSQASAEHFQQRAEFLPLRDRGLGPLAETMLSHCACQEGHRFRFSMPRKGLRPPFLRAFGIGLWFRSVNFLDSVV
jgi:hypothetical protein